MLHLPLEFQAGPQLTPLTLNPHSHSLFTHYASGLFSERLGGCRPNALDPAPNLNSSQNVGFSIVATPMTRTLKLSVVSNRVLARGWVILQGFNALHAAATAGQLEAVQMLLDAPGQLNHHLP